MTSAIELGERVHREMEHFLTHSPWVYVTDLYDRERLRAAGIKSKKRHYDLKPRIIPVFPRWAVELLEHPQCSKRMLTGARRHIAYRKEMLMETRFIKRREVRRREQHVTNLLCHQTAVPVMNSKRFHKYASIKAQNAAALWQEWSKLWPEMKRYMP
jgi:hypothetical protein